MSVPLKPAAAIALSCLSSVAHYTTALALPRALHPDRAQAGSPRQHGRHRLCTAQPGGQGALRLRTAAIRHRARLLLLLPAAGAGAAALGEQGHCIRLCAMQPWWQGPL